jgi:excisionase family DNA binding protein
MSSVLGMKLMKRTRQKRFATIEDLEIHPEANLAPEQLAKYWGVEVQTIRKWARAGALPAFRVGRALRVKRLRALAFERKGQLDCGGRST